MELQELGVSPWKGSGPQLPPGDGAGGGVDQEPS